MTDIRLTQIAVEQFASIIRPQMQVTNVALEMWVSTTNVTNPQMVVTTMAVEMWASVAAAIAAQQSRAIILA